MQEPGSFIHRPLKCFAAGDKPGASSPLIDDGCGDCLCKVVGSGGSATVNETCSAHIAVGHLITAKINRVITGELTVDPFVKLAVAGCTCVEGLEASIVLRKLLLDDVGLDRDA